MNDGTKTTIAWIFIGLVGLLFLSAIIGFFIITPVTAILTLGSFAFIIGLLWSIEWLSFGRYE